MAAGGGSCGRCLSRDYRMCRGLAGGGEKDRAGRFTPPAQGVYGHDLASLPPAYQQPTEFDGLFDMLGENTFSLSGDFSPFQRFQHILRTVSKRVFNISGIAREAFEQVSPCSSSTGPLPALIDKIAGKRHCDTSRQEKRPRRQLSIGGASLHSSDLRFL